MRPASCGSTAATTKLTRSSTPAAAAWRRGAWLADRLIEVETVDLDHVAEERFRYGLVDVCVTISSLVSVARLEAKCEVLPRPTAQSTPVWPISHGTTYRDRDTQTARKYIRHMSTASEF